MENEEKQLSLSDIADSEAITEAFKSTFDPVSTESPETKPDAETSEVIETPEVEDRKTSESEDTTPVDDKKDEGTDDVTIDPEYIALAKENGWEEEHVLKLYESDPDLANKTFSKLAETYDSLTQQLAQLGTSPTVNPTATPNAGQAEPANDILTQLENRLGNLDKVRETHGDDIVDDFLSPMKDVVATVRALQHQAEQQAQEGIIREINGQFDTLSQNYGEFYGKGDNQLSDDQEENRRKVLTLAADIRSGATLRGIDLTIEDAMKRAHRSITSELRNKQAQKEIIETIKKRSKSVGTQPTKSNAKLDAAPKSIEKAQEAFESKAEEIGFFTN